MNHLFVSGIVAVGLLMGQSTTQDRLSVGEVERMLNAHVPQDVIEAKIEHAGQAFNLTTNQIIALKQAGASDGLLRTMMAPAQSGKAATAPSPAEVTIPDGTEVKLLLKSPLTSATAQPEQRVEFTASEAVTVHGITVVEKGAPGAGHVTEAQPKKGFGRKGKLNFSIDTVQSISGENIRLRSAKAATGADSYGKAGVVTLLAGPLGGFVKGHDVEVAAGTEFTIYIDGDRKVELAKPGK